LERPALVAPPRKRKLCKIQGCRGTKAVGRPKGAVLLGKPEKNPSS